MKQLFTKIFTSRYTYIVIVGGIISMLLHTVKLADQESEGGNYSLLMSVLLTFLIWEGNLWLDKKFAARFPWTTKPIKRISIQVITNIVYSAGLIYIAMQVYNHFVCIVPEPTKEKFLSLSIIIGTLVSLLLLTVEFGTQFFNQWKLSLLEVEHYKQESIEAQLEVLKGQINPHFLFNNLSVLSSLVYIDQDKAVEFINQFSKVYRYVLEYNNRELVELKQELDFIDAYIYLLKIRFGNNIEFKVEIDKNYHHFLLVPMTLEILVENTIKHNEVSKENPLTVKIETTPKKYIVISNTLQLRNDVVPGTKLGLNNLKKRFSHYSNSAIEILSTATQFQVKIPLLSPHESTNR